MTDHFDIVIAGGGAAGLSLALAIKQAAGQALSVAVVDPDVKRAGRGDARAYTIVPGAARFFDSFGAWQAMAAVAGPVRRMEITDSSREELVRPLMLDFDAPEDGVIAHLVPNGAILSALTTQARALDVSLYDTQIDNYALDGLRVVAQTGHKSLSARLLVVADGRNSVLRQQAGIAYYGWRYRQMAIVGTISHSLEHEGVAVQHFLPAGPFAMLPLKDSRQSSIVWSEEPETARRLLAGDPDDLLREVDERAAGRFGTGNALSGAQGFPLSLGVARCFVGPRLALLGDAAHGLHPLAGQGLNYGLRGAASLAETIIDAARLGLDIGSEAALAAYEQARRPDVMMMALATEGLNRLFSSDFGPKRQVRDIGLGVVNRLPDIKAKIMREAAGAGRLAPRAFRGEAL